MQSDEELRTTYRVIFEEPALVHFVIKEVQHEEDDSNRQALLAQQDIVEIFQDREKRSVNGLVNLMPIGEARYISNRAKKIYIGLLTLPELKKLAFVVPTTFLKILTSFMTQLSGSWGHVHWFTSESEARQWLSEE